MLVFLLGTVSSNAQTDKEVNSNLDTLFGEHVSYQKFFEKLKQAIVKNDKQVIASMVDYPFHARINGKAIKINDQAHFINDYNKVITEKVRLAVINQTYANLFANWQGVSIGDGEVWFSGVGENNIIKITSIND